MINNLLPKDVKDEEYNEAKFFSTFDKQNKKYLSMLECISQRINNIKNGYNTVICGSGFYEDVEDGENLKVFNEMSILNLKNKIQQYVSNINPEQ